MADRDKFAGDANAYRKDKINLDNAKEAQMREADRQMIDRNQQATAMYEAAQRQNNQARKDSL